MCEPRTCHEAVMPIRGRSSSRSSLPELVHITEHNTTDDNAACASWLTSWRSISILSSLARAVCKIDALTIHSRTAGVTEAQTETADTVEVVERSSMKQILRVGCDRQVIFLR